MHAGFTSNATVFVKIYDAIIAIMQRLSWTYFHTWGIRAMIASGNLKYASCVRESPFLSLLDPSPIYPYGYVVLRLASDRAGMTANTLPVVDYESKFHSGK